MANATIVVLTVAADTSFPLLAAALRSRGIHAERFDWDSPHAGWSISIAQGSWKMRCMDGRVLTSEDGVLMYCASLPPAVHLYPLLQALLSDWCTVLVPFRHLVSAHDPVRQLRAATCAGITAPDWIFTNEPSAVQEFWARTSLHDRQADMERINGGEAYYERSSSIYRYATPQLFRPVVHGKRRRIAVVDGGVIPDGKHLSGERFVRMLDYLRVPFGTFDVVETANDIVFDRLHPLAGWDVVQQRTGFPVANAIAGVLQRRLGRLCAIA